MFLMQIAPAVDRHVDATRQSDIAFAADQRLAGLMDVDERGRTGGIDADCRPCQIELVRDPEGQILRFRQAAHTVVIGARTAVGHHSTYPVEVVAGACINANHTVVLPGVISSVLQGFPCDFMEYAELRVHDARILRGVPEEIRIELQFSFDRSGFSHVVRLGSNVLVDIAEVIVAEQSQPFPAVLEQLPEGVDIPCRWESTRHANDGDLQAVRGVCGVVMALSHVESFRSMFESDEHGVRRRWVGVAPECAIDGLWRY